MGGARGQQNSSAMVIAGDAVRAADYRIGPGDVLEVSVFDIPELNRTLATSATGQLKLPYLTKALDCAGRTVPEVAAGIAAELVREQLVIDPQVQVTVLKVLSRPVTVTGAVQHPMLIEIDRPTTVLEAILRAGGPNPANAGSEVAITTVGPTGQPQTRLTPLSAIMAGSSPDANVSLQGHEFINVLPQGQVFAVGGVNSPGAFAVNPGETLTVNKLLALSKGWKPEAQPAQASLVQVLPDGRTNTVAVNLPAIMARKNPDLTLHAGDILIVPVSEKRP